MPQETRNNEPVIRITDERTFPITKFEVSPPDSSVADEQSSNHPSDVRMRCCGCNNSCRKFWNIVISHPLCPSLPNFLRFLALVMLILMIWGSSYSKLGEVAGLKGQLFKIGFLGVTSCIAGYIAMLLKLPALLGMMLMGLLLRNINFVVFSGPYLQVTSTLREMALLIIIMRAGLELDPTALKKLGALVLKFLVIPAVTEAVIIAVMTHYLLDLPWMWGFILGSFIAAISPAVVLSSLFQIQRSGNYGTTKGIPTLVIAVMSINTIFCITVFGVLISIIHSTGSLVFQIISGPVGAAIGIVCGTALGMVLRLIPSQIDDRVSMLRTLLLAGGGLFMMFGSSAIGFVNAGPLGCIIYAYVASNGWDTIGKASVSDNFRLMWSVFEPILFGLIGNEIDIFVLHGSVVGFGVASLLVALLIRTVATALVATGGNFNWKEKIFISLAWIPKATVQAALAPQPLDRARELNMEENFPHAKILLIIGVLSILISAPLGSIIITTFGPKLLKKEVSVI